MPLILWSTVTLRVIPWLVTHWASRVGHTPGAWQGISGISLQRLRRGANRNGAPELNCR